MRGKKVRRTENMLILCYFDLSYDGGFTNLNFEGGEGAKSAPPPIFICENHRISKKIMHCVNKKII